MSERRRLLLAIANQFKWLPYSYENLYYGLVPVKVNRDKDLPNEYQQVEYIESTGTQYIDSLYVPNANTKIIFDTMMKSTSLAGVRQGRHGDGQRLSITLFNGTPYLEFAIGKYQQFYDNLNDERHVFELDVPNLQAKLDGVVKATFSAITWTNQQTLYFFARNTSSGADGLQGSCKNCNIKIYENDTPVRNFVTCYRKSDNVIGLFDTVNQVFYNNAGTGTFLKGADTYALVKNKARVEKVYGNSVVENQICDDIIEHTFNANTNLNEYVYSTINGTVNHKYLVSIKTKIDSSTNVDLMRIRWYNWASEGIATPLPINTNEQTTNIILTSTSSNISIAFQVRGDSSVVCHCKELQVIDLTQMFPFDTPTTLTDTRVQAILNRGYIPYNTGEIKSVDIGEIATTKSDTTALDTIAFKYQGAGVGTSHDTLERTDTEWVFTKYRNVVDLGSLNWSYDSYNLSFFATLNGMQQCVYGQNQPAPNLLCVKYISKNTYYLRQSDDKIISTNNNQPITNSRVNVKDTSFGTDSATFKTAMYGVMLEYELATPQVIRIPRKRLGVVDLGSLSWIGSDGNFYSSFAMKHPLNDGTIANLYCNKLLSVSRNSVVNTNLSIAYHSTADYLYAKDNSYTSATDFKNAMSGVYLFYETNTEVEDMPFLLGIESGGTITTDSEVLPNVDFEMKCK